MTRSLPSLAIFVLLAGTAMASPVETVLTSDSTLYTIDAPGEHAILEIKKRVGAERHSIIVPASADKTVMDSNARLAWDGRSETLYVLWHRRGEGSDEIVLSSMSASGLWSDAVVVAGASTVRNEGLQIVLTRAAAQGEEATLIHAVWWSLGATDQKAEYALVVFIGGTLASIERMPLDELSSMLESAAVVEVEDTGKAVHPPLAIERRGSGVEVVFGGVNTTTLNRVRVTPVLKITGQARLWRPLGRMSSRVPSAQLTSLTSDAVQALMIGGRIVLYTTDSAFRYVLFDDGQWSPARMIALDDKLTSDRMLDELRRTVETYTDPDVDPEN